MKLPDLDSDGVEVVLVPRTTIWGGLVELDLGKLAEQPRACSIGTTNVVAMALNLTVGQDTIQRLSVSSDIGMSHSTGGLGGKDTPNLLGGGTVVPVLLHVAHMGVLVLP